MKPTSSALHLIRFLLSWLLPSCAYTSSVVNVHYIEQNIIRFAHEGAENFSQLLFDENNQQLIAGGREFIFRLSLDDLMPLESHEWVSSNKTIEQCILKGQTALNCRNYITILHKNNGSILACGTNAFSPLCRRYSPHDLSFVLSEETGITKSPYYPIANITSHITADDNLFLGGPIDFVGNDFAFLRTGTTGPLLRTTQNDQKYLNRPQFIASFEIGSFIYFFFRESALEYMRCGQAVYSRVGRVCKNDSGSSIMKHTWTTFLKARLSCSLPGNIPFDFNEAQSVAYLSSLKTFYISFTTPDNSIYGTAVCSYTLNDIEAAFKGPLTGAMNDFQRGRTAPARFECNINDELTSDEMIDVKRFQQTFDVVRNARTMPLYHSNLERLVHLQADEVWTSYQTSVRVIFVVTLEGTLKKIVHYPTTDVTCVVEEAHLFRDGEKLNRLLLVKEKHALFAATDRDILRIPLSFCGQYESRETCVDSGDPYCGWDSREERCSTAPNDNVLDAFWAQGHVCPIRETPVAVNGSWGRWSSWRECGLAGAPAGELCKCRQRKCDSPAPSNGGTNCVGHNVHVVNCTRHGGWTDWTEWSACSAQCGPGFQHRSRTCSNPQPAFGGHDCIGTALEERGCPDNPICHPSVAVQIPKEVTHWNEWGEWSACSSPCGGGFQVRRRQCGTAMKTRECDLGCSKEYRSCNNHECPEVKSAPEWGEWHIVSPVSTTIVAGGSQRENRNGSLSTNPSTSAVSWLARRFRYQCIARVPYATSIRLVFSKNERSCQNHVDCYTSWAAHQETSENGSLWSTWSAWSPCSVSCGGGVQRRERVCNNRGHGNSGCSGLSIQEQQCNQEPCPIEGWSEWTPWSRCDNLSGEQQRKRQCIAKEQWRCLANVHTRESRSCLNDENVIASASIESQCIGVGLLTFTMAVILAYVSGLATIVLVVRTYNKRHQEEVLISGASGSLCNSIQGIHVPKHLASQPLVQAESNTYVPSSAFKGQFDVLNSQTASPVKVTATIKRSSTFRAQIEDDQNF